MNDSIRGFNGQYRFLSNFWPSLITVGGIQFATVEHAYQAAKAWSDSSYVATVAASETPGKAKRLGRSAKLDDRWEERKVTVMHLLLRSKFQIPNLRDALIATRSRELVEDNTWGDRFWGVCQGSGENNLGRLLMKVRGEIQDREWRDFYWTPTVA